MMQLSGRRIFYIEDDLKNRAIVQMIVEASGGQFAFERWGNPSEVVARLHQFAPLDLILLDLMFPRGITGYTIFEAIRRDAAFNHVPIVAVSASDPGLEIPKAQARGFSGYIAKPISVRTMPHLLAQILAGQQVWSSDLAGSL
jgi:CheY-like chemotaxis protein